MRIKQSKTDPFRQGADIYLGKTERAICPINRIIPYLAHRGGHYGPLFMFQDGRFLTRYLFSAAVDKLLGDVRIDTKLYSTRSFRIGAATSAMKANISEAHVQMLGRWRSEAYKRYIKTLPQELARFSKQLVTGALSCSTHNNL